MSNYKIRVNSEAESKEAQELFLKYGATGNMCLDQSIRYVCTFNGALTLYDFLPSIEFKRITLPQLRDMVVLKRNDAWDANYTYCGKPVLKLETQDYKVWNKLDKCWVEHTGSQTDLRAGLKPIEKPMKEYLRKNSNDTYSYIGMVQPENISQNVIEIPEGSETFNYYDRKDNLFFLKGTGENALFSNDLNDWEWKEWGDIDFDGVVCLWSRHNLPEELPFIDDEPSLGNSKIGRRAITVKVPVESLNDQYAEIEKVRQTLSQRQEQYGSFEDVAMITEQMVDVMRKGYYENLAYNQKMALYMICSKIARIVNGNPNHKDSWHDIAGYATLIDNELVSEKDMPF